MLIGSGIKNNKKYKKKDLQNENFNLFHINKIYNVSA